MAGIDEKMREDVFQHVFSTGAIRSVSLSLDSQGRALVVYVQLDGATGSIYTKRGGLKLYRVETALRMLRGLGVATLTVDMTALRTDGQASLDMS